VGRFKGQARDLVVRAREKGLPGDLGGDAARAFQEVAGGTDRRARRGRGRNGASGAGADASGPDGRE